MTSVTAADPMYGVVGSGRTEHAPFVAHPASQGSHGECAAWLRQSAGRSLFEVKVHMAMGKPTAARDATTSNARP